MSQNQETRGFQSEVKQLLQLMIHSLYSNKEIFLRELISNASDAADKLRFKALSAPELYEGDGELRVRISADKDKGTLTISDNGIGMNREQIIDNLGTIAKSGTKAFLNELGAENAKDSNLIGQFGVGFYSAFIVADKVSVKSRQAGESADKGVLWESSGEGEYQVADIEKTERGTEITLHLREDEKEFLDDWRLREVINKYSDHIDLPVELLVQEFDDEGKETGVKWEKVNKAQALWTRNKSEISDDEYKEFYKHISHDFNEPLLWAHNRVEGKQEYTNLLYLPEKAPWDLFNREYKHGLKLYVQRVFIMDDAEQFMPNYLRFMKGLIDSNDLPLNVSREILQDNKVTQALRKALTKRALGMMEKLSQDKEKYAAFWKEFGLVLKEGVAEDFANKEAIAKLLRFASTHNDSSEQTVSLEDYISRMKEGQKAIYYLTADSYIAAKNSPHLELFNKKGIEVLLLSDRIDEFMLGYLTEFDGKPLQAITKSDLDLGDLADKEDESAQKAKDEAFASFIERVKGYLGDRVKDVRLTHRLSDTPAVVSTDNDQMTTQMAKLFAAAGQAVPEVKYTFELNPEHTLVQRTADISDEAEFAEWVELLLDQALLSERGALENPAAFIKRMNKLLG
ncbi:molecular chaperone HtpG [Pasteurellaceae bacterium HPA106]|uniref:molecular chaperone HtpG n=1 Tax=Spirabiliibacterium pneumoniae TaxID=221400 RepID=UPI001AADE138|nr:molecular chaperone HtpG [Spirabiliibacterium pneumoniae]MBE2896370.1 molecular chaperone HtpG [Spirabiliibacterium pneumoniae]